MIRLPSLAWLAVSCVSYASAMAETQHIEIYQYTGNTYPPRVENSTKLWRNGCVALVPSMCTDSVRDMAGEVHEAHEAFNEAVGIDHGDGSRTIKVFIHTFTNEELAEYDAEGGSIYIQSSIAGDWHSTVSRRPTIFQEMGHALFDKLVGGKTCRHNCTPADLEHWGLDEGIAKVVESFGGGVFNDPTADSVQGIINQCKTSTEDEVEDCAHDIGDLLVASFDALALELESNFPDAQDPAAAARKWALMDFYKPVLRDMPRNQRATFANFHDRLGSLVYTIHIRPQATAPEPPTYGDSYAYPIWHEWLDMFFLRLDEHRRRNGDEAPH